MPTKQEVHIDKILTNISVQYWQDASAFIADMVFPRVNVAKQSDKYFTYAKEDWFRDDAEKRAMGTESAGGDYEVDKQTYYCERYAFHKDVYDEERSNTDAPLQPDEDATMFVVEKVRLQKENLWAKKFFKTGVWGTDIEGVNSGATSGQVIQWDNYDTSDPIINMSTYSTAMSEVTGKRPNTLVLGTHVYNALKNHPDILDRIKYSQKGVITNDLIAELFDVERILVANAIQNTAKKGQEAEMKFIMGNHALLCYTTGRPGLRTATAGYTFAWTGLLGGNALGGRINRIPVPLLGIGTERIEAETCYDMKVVAADMGIFFNNVVAGPGGA